MGVDRRPAPEELPLTPEPAPSRRRLAAVVAVEVLVSALVLWAVLVWPSPLAWYLDLVLALAVATAVAAWWWRTAPDRVLASLPLQPIDDRRHARYANLVDGLCLAFGVEPPALHVLDDPGLNAASVAGPGQAHLVCTSGLLEHLDRVSLEGVIAHELAHVRSGDTATATTAVAMIGYPLLGGDGPAGRALRPVGEALAGTRDRLFLWCLGADRELEADLAAVQVTRYPPGLYQALQAIRRSVEPVAAAHPSTAPLWIQDPRGPAPAGARSDRAALHPPLDHRLDVLGEL